VPAVFQDINYTLSFMQTGSLSSFTGYFAPEYDINLALTFRDLDNDNGSGKKTNPDLLRTFSFNQAPIIRQHTETGFIGTGMLSGNTISEVFSGTPASIQPYR